MAVYRESVVFYMACDPALLLYSGFAPIELPSDAVLPTDMVALGGGELVSVPDFRQLLGGTAERIEATMSGVSPEITRLALDDAPSVRGAAVHVGIIHFNDDWSVDSVEWEAKFEARSLSITRGLEQNGNINRTITLTIVQGDTTRARANNAYFTDSDQRRRSPDDAIFSHVAGIQAGTSRRFGPSD